MKSFIKYTLACLLALVLFTVVTTIITLVSFAGMMASDGMTASVKDNTILRINLGGALEEQTQDDPFSSLMNNGMETVAGLQTLTEAIQKAKENEHVKGIYLENATLGGTPATVQELRQALTDFKKSGKFIVAYSDTYSQSGYYIASVADKILLNPEGMVDWHGLASQPMFFKDAMAKVGVRMQVFKVGTFKSAVEPYINTEMSEANREQVNSYLTSIWNSMLKDISAARKIDTDKLNTLADEYVALHPAQYMVDSRLVDTLSYIDGVKAYLKQKMDVKEDESLNFITPKDMANAEIPGYKEQDDKVAVYYAVGDIVQTSGNVSPMSGNGPQIVGEKVIDDLRALREDKNVKAVVLRVNSGGGSAYASEQIWREVELLKAEKPVVVSMGGLAASGGYYISSGANKIIAEPTTLTGSIGIFGMVADMSELITQKVGVKFDVVKTNALSDMGTMARPMNAEEGQLMQSMVERGYETFTGRVAMGRKMKIEDVKAIAEGRVWTGEQAKERGLVDQLGNLDAAIKVAAKLAKLEKYNRVNYPEPEPWYQSLLSDKKSGYMEAEMRDMLGEYYTTFALIRSLKSQDRIQARLPFEPNIK
ncbi:MAG: signal peptide peptidase SppA [Bacteroidaceae bacterium]|nr:signal peptide peptidase SppA [Bacteroidaceae bacterium]